MGPKPLAPGGAGAEHILWYLYRALQRPKRVWETVRNRLPAGRPTGRVRRGRSGAVEEAVAAAATRTGARTARGTARAADRSDAADAADAGVVGPHRGGSAATAAAGPQASGAVWAPGRVWRVWRVRRAEEVAEPPVRGPRQRVLPEGRVFKEPLALNGSGRGLRKPRASSSAKTARRGGVSVARSTRSRAHAGRGRPQTACGPGGRLTGGWSRCSDPGSFRMVLDQLPARAQNERRKNHCRATSSIELLRRQGGLQIASTKGSECKWKAQQRARNVQGSREGTYLDAGVVSPLDGAATGLRAPLQAFCSH